MRATAQLLPPFGLSRLRPYSSRRDLGATDAKLATYGEDRSARAGGAKIGGRSRKLRLILEKAMGPAAANRTAIKAAGVILLPRRDITISASRPLMPGQP